MKLPASFANAATRFDRMTVRERVLVCAAALAALLVLWDTALMGPVDAKRLALSAELTSLQEGIALNAASMETAIATDPTSEAQKQLDAAQASLATINGHLVSATVGLIPPERMADVLRDVLGTRAGIRLVSLRSGAVKSLVQSAPNADATALNPATEAVSSGPFVHTVEMTVDGRYLDILDYLRALESLPWHLYWKGLDLNSLSYPTNRVRIEVTTLSLDKAWLGT